LRSFLFERPALLLQPLLGGLGDGGGEPAVGERLPYALDDEALDGDGGRRL